MAKVEDKLSLVNRGKVSSSAIAKDINECASHAFLNEKWRSKYSRPGGRNG
jgi:hypothetical protein